MLSAVSAHVSYPSFYSSTTQANRTNIEDDVPFEWETLRNSQSQATVSSSKRHAFLPLEKLFFMPAVHFCLTVASIYCDQHLKPF